MNASQTAVQPLTRDGRSWSPSYLLAIDPKRCMGCGRCFKVCGRSVMELMGFTEEGAIVGLDDDEEILHKVMTVADPGACIGCGACSHICPTNCQTHGPA